MADDVQVTIGANTSSLNAGVEAAKAQLRALSAEAQNLARQMVVSGQAGNNTLVTALGSISQESGRVASTLRIAENGLASIAGALTESGEAARHGGTGFGFYVKELRVLADEASAGRTRNLLGSVTNIFGHLMSDYPQVAAMVAGVGALAGALGYLILKSHEAAAEAKQLQEGFAFGQQITMSKAEIDSLIASLNKVPGVAGIIESSAKEINAVFLHMSNSSKELIGAIVLDLTALGTQMGATPLDGVKVLAKAFSEPPDDAAKLAHVLNQSLTPAQQDTYNAAYKTGDILKQQAAIQDILAEKIQEMSNISRKEAQDSLENVNKKIDANNRLIASQSQFASEARTQNVTLATVANSWQMVIDKINALNTAIGKQPGLLRETALSAGAVQTEFDKIFKAGTPEQGKFDQLERDISILSKGRDGTGELPAANGVWPPPNVTFGTAGSGSAQTSATDALSQGLRDSMERLASSFGAFTVTSTTEGQHAPGSQHYDGNAIDVSTSGWSAEKYTAAIADAIKAGFTGIGISGTHLHLDTRESTSGAQVFADQRGNQTPVFGKSPAEWAAQFGGSGPGSSSVSTNATSAGNGLDAQTVELIKQKRDEELAVNQAKEGGNLIEQARVANQKADLAGGSDEVANAQRIVDAAQRQLDLTQSVNERRKVTQQLTEAQLGLEKAKNAVTEAGLQRDIEAARLKHDDADELAVQQRRAAFKRADTAEGTADAIKADSEEAAAKAGFAEKQKQLAMDTADHEIAQEQRATEMKIALYETQFKTRQITEAQKTALTEAALQQELAAETSILQQELTIETLTAKQKQDINEKLTQLQEQNAQRVMKAQADAAEKSAAAWKSAEDDVAGVINSQVDGILRGTTSISQAFKNMAADIIEQIIKYCIKWGIEHAGAALMATASNTAMVGAHLAGNAAMQGSDAMTAAAGAGAQAEGAISSIFTSAAKTFAGIFGFMSPMIGPAAAGPAAAGEATVLGITSMVASRATGDWRVPNDMLAMIHKDEMVVPSRGGIANQFRDFMEGGGFARGGAQAAASGGGAAALTVNSPVHFHAPGAMDQAGVGAFFRSNQRQLMVAIRHSVRSGAHLALGTVGTT